MSSAGGQPHVVEVALSASRDPDAETGDPEVWWRAEWGYAESSTGYEHSEPDPAAVVAEVLRWARDEERRPLTLRWIVADEDGVGAGALLATAGVTLPPTC